jgi:hypothetical protein
LVVELGDLHAMVQFGWFFDKKILNDLFGLEELLQVGILIPS